MTKTILACVAAALLLAACNTFQGMGQDIKDAGQGISSAAQTTKDKIENR